MTALTTSCDTMAPMTLAVGLKSTLNDLLNLEKISLKSLFSSKDSGKPLALTKFDAISETSPLFSSSYI